VLAEHVGQQRLALAPRRQGPADALAEARRIAAIEVEQMRPLQRERVARMIVEDMLPRVAGTAPVASGEQAQGDEMAALAIVAFAGQRLGRVERRVRGADDRGLGQAQQEAGLHQPRQEPVRVGGDGGVEVVERRAVERHHSPERALARVERRCRRGRYRVAARIAPHRRRPGDVSPAQVARARAVASAASLPRRVRPAAP